ncbi:MAG: hypothetical protein ACTSVA_00950 [Candidatus Njordarchaeales archaeon]
MSEKRNYKSLRLGLQIVILSEKTMDSLIAFLKEHQSDIAAGFEDYGTLYSVFEEIIGHRPEED